MWLSVLQTLWRPTHWVWNSSRSKTQVWKWNRPHVFQHIKSLPTLKIRDQRWPNVLGYFNAFCLSYVSFFLIPVPAAGRETQKKDRTVSQRRKEHTCFFSLFFLVPAFRRVMEDQRHIYADSNWWQSRNTLIKRFGTEAVVEIVVNNGARQPSRFIGGQGAFILALLSCFIQVFF